MGYTYMLHMPKDCGLRFYVPAGFEMEGGIQRNSGRPPEVRTLDLKPPNAPSRRVVF